MHTNLMSLFQILNQDMEQESDGITDNIIRSETNEDHISKLPNDVLRQILSLHPLNSGSKAVALLRRLSKETSIITVKTEDIESVIGDILVMFDEKKPMKNPTKFEFHLSNDLIMTASLGLNKKLHLDFSKGHDQEKIPTPFWLDILLNNMDFVLALSTCSSLNLKLTSINYQTVKTLKLTSVNYLSCDFVSSLISNFPYVEGLIIEKCEGPWALSVEGLAKLKSLRVLDCDDIELVFLNAWALDSLWYSGPLCRFCLESRMHLRDVKLDIKGPGISDYHLSRTLYNPLLHAIQDVSVLTLHGWMVKDIFAPLLSSQQDFNFRQIEDLWWIDSCMEDDNINCLFGFLKFCTSLKRLFISIDKRSYSSPSEHLSPTKVQKGLLRHLKVVKMEGFEKEEDIIWFKEHLMQVFNVEPRIVEVRKGMQGRYLFRFPKRQAINKNTQTSKFKFCYKFVDEVEDNTGLCSKHPHMP